MKKLLGILMLGWYLLGYAAPTIVVINNSGQFRNKESYDICSSTAVIDNVTTNYQLTTITNYYGVFQYHTNNIVTKYKIPVTINRDRLSTVFFSNWVMTVTGATYSDGYLYDFISSSATVEYTGGMNQLHRSVISKAVDTTVITNYRNTVVVYTNTLLYKTLSDLNSITNYMTGKTNFSENELSVFVDNPTGWTDTWHSYDRSSNQVRTVIRNTNCWAYAIDMTGISPWNNFDLTYRAGALITEKHMVSATHFPMTIGTVVKFIGPTNQILSNAITKAVDLGNDIMLYELSQNVPNYITPLFVIKSFDICTVSNTYPLDTAAEYFFEKISYLNAPTIMTVGFDRFEHIGLRVGQNPVDLNFGFNATLYDSGNAVCYVVSNKLAIQYCFKSPAMGGSIPDAIPAITNQISLWGSTNLLKILYK